MTTILLIRHGETAWNRDEIFRGRADVPLSSRGFAQAEAAARAVSSRNPVTIYSSPLARALQTADALYRVCPDSSLVQHPAFTDISYGEWEGLALSEVRSRWTDLYGVWTSSPDEFRAPGGEGLGDVEARAMPALEAIARSHPDAEVAVVSHRVVNKVIICSVVGAGPKAFWRVGQDVACLNIIDFDGGHWKLSRLNDTCHLEAAGAAPDLADF